MRLRLERKHCEYERIQLSSPRSIYEFMRELGEESSEFMYQLLMDTKHRVHGVYEVSKGGIDGCHVDPREVFKAALVTNSPAFALVHNHPSGVPDPSPADEALTRRIYEGAKLLDLDFTDSIIIGDGRYFSFHEAGRMPRSVV